MLPIICVMQFHLKYPYKFTITKISILVHCIDQVHCCSYSVQVMVVTVVVLLVQEVVLIVI